MPYLPCTPSFTNLATWQASKMRCISIVGCDGCRSNRLLVLAIAIANYATQEAALYMEYSPAVWLHVPLRRLSKKSYFPTAYICSSDSVGMSVITTAMATSDWLVRSEIAKPQAFTHMHSRGVDHDEAKRGVSPPRDWLSRALFPPSTDDSHEFARDFTILHTRNLNVKEGELPPKGGKHSFFLPHSDPHPYSRGHRDPNVCSDRRYHIAIAQPSGCVITVELERSPSSQSNETPRASPSPVQPAPAPSGSSKEKEAQDTPKDVEEVSDLESITGIDQLLESDRSGSISF
ncbi:hypothetical protein Y032_0143g2376 [Ancylostoma ceylanicum]|uniref:Uncharacterized protein n=1 Tax=Ancylostoma ceylanicum TaxID=53326 RepID=A0A016T3E6_9BILA|nr:hypothetical protein Y032_0143g2376 [Ancylostoma ceylanicum]